MIRGWNGQAGTPQERHGLGASLARCSRCMAHALMLTPATATLFRACYKLPTAPEARELEGTSPPARLSSLLVSIAWQDSSRNPPYPSSSFPGHGPASRSDGGRAERAGGTAGPCRPCRAAGGAARGNPGRRDAGNQVSAAPPPPSPPSRCRRRRRETLRLLPRLLALLHLDPTCSLGPHRTWRLALHPCCRNRGKGQYGCSHYRRRVKFITPCWSVGSFAGQSRLGTCSPLI